MQIVASTLHFMPSVYVTMVTMEMALSIVTNVECHTINKTLELLEALLPCHTHGHHQY